MLSVERTAFDDAKQCLAAKNKAAGQARTRARQYRSGDGGHVFYNAILAAATPAHFRHLVRLQGGWAPGRNAGVTFRDVVDSVKHMMDRSRRGIFVSFRGGKLSVFQPFSGVSYSNGVIGSTTKGVKRVFGSRPGRVHPRPSEWYVNHCWVDAGKRAHRTPTEWWTTEYLYFFGQLSDIDDVDFLVNNSDFPAAPRDVPGTQLPVLGAVSHPDYLDLPMPTPDDVEYVSRKVFLHLASSSTCRDLYTRPFRRVAWSRKRPVGVFRGSMSGCGTTAAANPRARLARISARHPDILDAGITSVDAHVPRYDPELRELHMIDAASLGIRPAAPIDLRDQSAYKYILNVEGYVGAFRYLFLLSSGSLVINVRTPWRMWYERWIEPGKHVIEVASVDHVVDAIAWCRENDDACHKIAKSGALLHRKLASMSSMRAYMADICRGIHRVQGLRRR